MNKAIKIALLTVVLGGAALTITSNNHLEAAPNNAEEGEGIKKVAKLVKAEIIHYREVRSKGKPSEDDDTRSMRSRYRSLMNQSRDGTENTASAALKVEIGNKDHTLLSYTLDKDFSVKTDAKKELYESPTKKKEDSEERDWIRMMEVMSPSWKAKDGVLEFRLNLERPERAAKSLRVAGKIELNFAKDVTTKEIEDLRKKAIGDPIFEDKTADLSVELATIGKRIIEIEVNGEVSKVLEVKLTNGDGDDISDRWPQKGEKNITYHYSLGEDDKDLTFEIKYAKSFEKKEQRIEIAKYVLP